MEASKVPESERQRNDDDEKIVAEWGASADDQILWAGLAVVAALALLFTWQTFFGGDDADPDSVVAGVVDQLPDGPEFDVNDDGQIAAAIGGGAIAQADDAPNQALDDTDQNSTDDADIIDEPQPTVVEVDEPGLQVAISGLPGTIAGSVAAGDSATGNVVTLSGFVANDQEATAAVAAASAVDGVDSVIDDLSRLEPVVSQALSEANVIDSQVTGDGTTVVVSGVIQSENDRAATLEAASSVPGVTSVVDQLQVSVAQNLNELPTIPFVTNSDQILAAGQDTIEQAAAIIIAAGTVQLEVQGYTDTVGDAASNLTLSSARAQAVTQALIDAGVPSDQLTPQGFGETDRFGEGTSPEALAANRVVRFEQTD